ncbi:hypothetical protein LTR91_003392 [Friedmanniomyces endolithicus]|uniref:Major facilitator superfamily (MFS) profile domain-containing protein n=1 Tax=Friedmanniomyces endolithicus TaxID=329885 RepID=A0A4U0U4H1_9PEZI|nr:hypothetical protein LTS09_016554 [Friedmanniomyces endolithicus]KAK0352193.1 hypothetical protein LTR94_021843 [Friedmanniomyces endolithicus]KAK0771368.1 hypothetical protein LTR38_017240 [Friedmanniomyces endolithicus]KAK0958819.1 hypothetical protein LTS01_021692 [Friedmanniomyces endolithicus]KAK1007862.1 hypothetical protein LTR91_003392 [Friedmanniomyces endolithicus]
MPGLIGKVPTFPKTYNVYFLAIISTVGGMLFGFDISSMSAIVGTQQYLDYFGNPAGSLQGAIGSALAAGSIIGCLIAGPISDRIGRRDACMFACLWWLAGTSVQVATTSVGMLIAGRMLNGVCVGITSSQVPVYLAEIAKKNMRGSILVIQQLAIEVGILIMFFIGYGCSFIPGESASFRTAWGIQFIPCLVLIAGLPFLPRSPRWLAKVGRVDEAVDILARIQAGGDQTDPMVIAEWEEITTVLAAERVAPAGWRRFIKNGRFYVYLYQNLTARPSVWRRTLAGFSVQAWQQLSGANVMTYYIVYVFLMAGLTGNANLTSGGIQYALFIVFTLVTYAFIDKTGRRPLLIYGALGMALCHFVIGGMLLNYGQAVPGGVQGNANVLVQVSGSPAYTVIAFSYLLIIVYALTLAPIAWVYAAEVWSLETRAYGMSIAALGNWIFNFALGMFIPPAFRNIGGGAFIVFGCLCVLAAIQSFLLYPETAKKSLEEIEEMFRPGGPKPWRTKPGESQLDASADDVVRRASMAHESGKGQVLHKDGTVGMADSDSEKKEEV